MALKKNASSSTKQGQTYNAGQRRVRQQSSDIPPFLAELEKWEQSNYDGIKGAPPLWVPEPRIKEFRREVLRLFHLVEKKEAPYAEIRSRFDYLVQNKYGAIVLALARDAKPYDEDLRRLVNLYQVSSLPPEEGIRQVAGETAAAGFRATTAYQKRDEFLERPEVQRIAREKWDIRPDLTITAIIKSPELAAYRKKYKGKHTLRNWLSAVDLRPQKAKRGRPKTTK